MWSGMKEITSLEDLSERAAQSKKKKRKKVNVNMK